MKKKKGTVSLNVIKREQKNQGHVSVIGFKMIKLRYLPEFVHTAKHSSGLERYASQQKPKLFFLPLSFI